LDKKVDILNLNPGAVETKMIGNLSVKYYFYLFLIPSIINRTSRQLPLNSVFLEL